MNNRKKIILFIIISIFIVTITGTLAYLSWVKKIGRMVLTVGDITTTEVNVSPYLITGNFSPVLTYANEEYSSIKVTNNESTTKNVIIEYDVLNIDSELNSESMKYTVTKSSNGAGPYTEYTSGNFASVSSGDKLEILNETVPSNEAYYYRVYLWIDGSSGEQSSMVGKNIEIETTVEVQNVITGADMLIEKANLSTLSYSSATTTQKGEMWTFSQAATEQTSATTDYRYIGASPNNYITFNNETWRIIGVFDGRIKIIKDTATNLIWDYKKSGVGSSTSDFGSNDWSDAQIMHALNNNFLGTDSTILKTGYTYDGTYVKDGSGNIIYKNGCKPASIATGATSYSCTSLGWTLNSTALNQIDKVTYYLGRASISFNSNNSVSDYYNFERGTIVPSGRPTSWSGYVGLMYASDYGYTYALGVDDTCYGNLNNCTTSNGATPSSSWLFNSAGQWLLIPHSAQISVFVVNSTGVVINTFVSNQNGVRPCVYLKSNIKLTGSGTSSDPYVIQ